MGNKSTLEGSNNCACKLRLEVLELRRKNTEFKKNQEILENEIKDLNRQLDDESQTEQEASSAGINRELTQCATRNADIQMYKTANNQNNLLISKLREQLENQRIKLENYDQLIFKKTESVELDSDILMAYFLNTINEIIPTLKLTKSDTTSDSIA